MFRFFSNLHFDSPFSMWIFCHRGLVGSSFAWQTGGHGFEPRLEPEIFMAEISRCFAGVLSLIKFLCALVGIHIKSGLIRRNFVYRNSFGNSFAMNYLTDASSYRANSIVSQVSRSFWHSIWFRFLHTTAVTSVVTGSGT